MDCGPISNPDGLRNQTEGGALQGMSRALGEEVAWDDEKVTSFDWPNYHSLPLGFDVPKLEVTMINRPDEKRLGRAKRRSPWSLRPLPMRSSTPPAPAFAKCHLLPSA